MIAIINYGMGNLGSVQNALDYLGVDSTIVDDPDMLSKFDKAILPGVGAFGMAMENLRNNNFDEAILQFAKKDEKPFLGICLGMQLMLDSSMEHGNHLGLGLVSGNVLDFNDVIKHSPIQHVGWNSITKTRQDGLFSEVEDDSSFYFVHRFYCKLENLNEVSATTDYEMKFHSALQKDNIFATQFHPEKSQKSGLSVFKKFAEL